MKQIDQIEIPRVKKEMLPILFFYIILIVFCVLFVVSPAAHTTPFSRYSNPIVLFVIGLLGLIVVIPIALTLIRRLLDKAPGLIINKGGVIDNIMGDAISLLWTDIKDIRSIKIKKNQFLAIIVKDPCDCIDKVKSSVRRDTMKSNYKNFGTPIVITDDVLQIRFDDLYHLLLEKMKEYKQ